MRLQLAACTHSWQDATGTATKRDAAPDVELVDDAAAEAWRTKPNSQIRHAASACPSERNNIAAARLAGLEQDLKLNASDTHVSVG
ncbi:hypothetical protein MY4824_001386 [Beauveria thailandica]